MELVTPSLTRLPAYLDALERGWTPDNERGAAVALEEMQKVRTDPAAFIGALLDPQGKGGPVKLPDGTLVPRLPGERLWMWEGSFCGNISLRWQEGTALLPPHCLGHIGYTVVPWEQRKGYATRALAMVLEKARAREMPYVEITASVDNIPSQRVIIANGGKLVEEFDKPAQYSPGRLFRFRIDLT